ncbi:chromosome partitioning protein ParB [Listeria monocytogenes]|nr:chromosome partitioning protein ParB [Listeria monocytogenes]EAC9253478.1 chromosome partitioning protein ParB [Listeria monocytogenes]
MNIQEIEVSKINPAAYNPRMDLQPGDLEYENLKKSIEQFGYIDPLIWNERTGNLVGGHQRFKVLLEGNPEKLTVSVVHLDINQEKALNIALNKIEGGWSTDKLGELLKSINDEETLNLTGFSALEIDELIKEFELPPATVDKVKENPLGSNLFESFLFPPFSYLDSKTKRWRDRKDQWKNLGIRSELGREGNLTFASSLRSASLTGTSIFDPVLCELAYRWFTPKESAKIYDPFAGGSVRGIVAKVLGHEYTGIDLREEQVEANHINAKEIGLDGINWITDNSLNADKHIEDNSMDLLFTCPPYFDLEVYSDNKEDISNMEYEEFIKVYSEILDKGANKLKDNRFAIVVISDVRDKAGFYRDLTGLTKSIFEKNGIYFYNDLILLNSLGSGALRARRNMRNRKLVRIHQNVLVFYKGNPDEIQEHFPILEVLEDNLEEVLESIDI